METNALFAGIVLFGLTLIFWASVWAVLIKSSQR
jgi:hypothetical protein